MSRNLSGAAAGALLILLAATTTVRADWDEARERRDAAQRAAEARRHAESERQAQAMRTQAEAKHYRGVLGAQAAGKSDAEVIAMGHAWQAKVGAQARAAQADYTARYGAGGERINASIERAQQQAPARQAQAEAMIRQASGGKHQRMEDLANLSDAELEAMARRAAAAAQGGQR